jgi:hypothetical protein
MQVITRHRTDSEIYEASFLPNYGVLGYRNSNACSKDIVFFFGS